MTQLVTSYRLTDSHYSFIGNDDELSLSDDGRNVHLISPKALQWINKKKNPPISFTGTETENKAKSRP
jgi:hypothetical protein